jgi:polysaccharide pyruvyl transferase WcaK-like protein
MKIAIFGTFDVENYGDNLFPLVARYRWKEVEWINVSPRYMSPIYKESSVAISVEQAEKMKFDAILIGGGNIIHTSKTVLIEYAKIKYIAYPSLWIGAAKIAFKQRIPLFFNAPGIYTEKFNYFERKLMKIVLESSNYINFRDAISSELASNFTSKKIFTVPDTAFDISTMWTLNPTKEKNYIIVNLNKRYHKPAKETAVLLDLIGSITNKFIKIIIISKCHGDLEFSKEVLNYMKHPCKIEYLKSLQEIAFAIGNSDFFIGSSMHGYITALSYKVPALLVLNESPISKFTGLLNILNVNDNTLCKNWNEVVQNIKFTKTIDDSTLDKIKIKLDRHWDTMKNLIDEKNDKSTSYILLHYKKIIAINGLIKNINL